MESVAWIKLTCFAVVCAATVAGAPHKSVDEDVSHRDPWQINLNACPPVLCGPPQSSLLLTAPPAGVDYEPVRVQGRFEFFEGDIVLKSAARTKRAIIRPISKLWKFGIVPYVLDSSLTTSAKRYIGAAIRSFERKTCIRFIPKSKEHVDYIMFINQPGCWSYVGKQGGEQHVSLGAGCDNFGTVLHETAHALGFWHEQSRPDRDTFVKLIKKNIPSRFLSQFGKRDSEESSTRGYAYDYDSIMHYGERYFSSNNRATLKVIGIGRKMKKQIGQRKRLSDIDVAQLRAMYYCNKKDQRDRVCRDGWNKFDDHCYKFVNDQQMAYGSARKYCQAEGGYLAHINSQPEDNYIKGYLINFYPNTTTWRTGGKMENGKFVWYFNSGQESHVMNYTRWAPNWPGRFSTHILSKYNGSPPRFVWKATWSGSTSKRTAQHPFICEAETSMRCFKSSTGDGRDYRGKLDYTTDGTTCQMWASRYPQQHKFYTGNPMKDVRNGIGEHNYCRNPNGRRAKPWCFVPLSPGSDLPRWQYCDVEPCKK